MNESDRLKRDREIVRLYEDGVMPIDIGRRWGLRADRVRNILKNRGYVFEYKPPMQRGDSIWEQGENKRRQAIWARAKRGAQEALRHVA
jgi:hypothetical protein